MEGLMGWQTRLEIDYLAIEYQYTKILGYGYINHLLLSKGHALVEKVPLENSPA